MVSRRHLRATLRKWISRRSAYSAKRRAKELDVWNQIRRTEEESMEMGTMDNTLLPDEYAVTKGLVSAVETLLSKTGA
jgi:hypothetical protein